MKRIVLLIFLISCGITAKTQPDFVKNPLWFKSPLEKELSGKYWEELTDMNGIGFSYTKDNDLAYILDLITETTSLYTGWSKRVTSSRIQELTFFVLGESVARFSYRNDRSVELMEWTMLPFMQEVLSAKSLLEVEKAVMNIKAYVNQSNANSFRELVKDITISLDKNFKDGLIPLGYNVAFNDRGLIIREYITGLSDKAFGSLKEIKCYDHSEIGNKSLNGDDELYVMIAREYRDKIKSLELRNVCSYNEIIIDGMHFIANSYHENGSLKAEISAAFEGVELLNGAFIEYLHREEGIRKPTICCKMEDVNGRAIGACDAVKIRKEIMGFFQVHAKSLNEQMTYNSAGVLEKSLNSRLTMTIDLKDEIYVLPQEDPEFPGGYTGMMAFIQKNFNYPQRAIENNIQGKCYVKFVVKPNGMVGNVQVERGIKDCPECDQEAIRLLKMMPKWKPAKVGNGKVVPSLFRLPINFALY